MVTFVALCGRDLLIEFYTPRDLETRKRWCFVWTKMLETSNVITFSILFSHIVCYKKQKAVYILPVVLMSYIFYKIFDTKISRYIA
jgi:hypothetical protein